MNDKLYQQDWHNQAAHMSWDGRALIDGRRVDGGTDMGICSPVDGRHLYNAMCCTAEIVDLAVKSARKAFDKGRWCKISPRERGSVLMRLAELIIQHHEELALRDTLEMGKPISSALTDAVAMAPALCRYYAESADKMYGDVAGSDAACLAFSLREPRGVVAAIAPWNYPLPNAVIKSIPALVTGNCVVLKPSEMTPGSALRLGELALEAGVPEGVFNIIPGDGPVTGAALLRHPMIDMITFTGSTETGKSIAGLSAQSGIRPLILECGGKSPQIVFPDAPASDQLASHILNEAFTNQGQICVARSRLLVHRSRKDELISILKEQSKTFSPGDPLSIATKFGPVAGARQFKRISSYIAGAVQAGATMVVGGASGQHCGINPVIFDDVTDDMAIVQEEVFGPVLTIQSFDTTEEALRLANNTIYGLAATVWTAHYPTAQKMFRNLKTGHVAVMSSLEPFEGPGFALAGEAQGASGYGCETGLDALRSYTAIKGVILGG